MSKKEYSFEDFHIGKMARVEFKPSEGINIGFFGKIKKICYITKNVLIESEQGRMTWVYYAHLSIFEDSKFPVGSIVVVKNITHSGIPIGAVGVVVDPCTPGVKFNYVKFKDYSTCPDEEFFFRYFEDEDIDIYDNEIIEVGDMVKITGPGLFGSPNINKGIKGKVVKGKSREGKNVFGCLAVEYSCLPVSGSRTWDWHPISSLSKIKSEFKIGDKVKVVGPFAGHVGYFKNRIGSTGTVILDPSLNHRDINRSVCLQYDQKKSGIFGFDRYHPSKIEIIEEGESVQVSEFNYKKKIAELEKEVYRLNEVIEWVAIKSGYITDRAKNSRKKNNEK